LEPVHQPVFLQACQVLFPTQIQLCTTAHNTLLPHNINFMPCKDISNNKELGTITDTLDMHNNLEVRSKVDSDTLNKLWDRIKDTEHLTTTTKAINRGTRTIQDRVVTKTRVVVAAGVDTVDVTLTTIATNTKIITILNNMVDTADNPTE
jgi:hypothetical protein